MHWWSCFRPSPGKGDASEKQNQPGCGATQPPEGAATANASPSSHIVNTDLGPSGHKPHPLHTHHGLTSSPSPPSLSRGSDPQDSADEVMIASIRQSNAHSGLEPSTQLPHANEEEEEEVQDSPELLLAMANASSLPAPSPLLPPLSPAQPRMLEMLQARRSGSMRRSDSVRSAHSMGGSAAASPRGAAGAFASAFAGPSQLRQEERCVRSCSNAAAQQGVELHELEILMARDPEPLAPAAAAADGGPRHLMASMPSPSPGRLSHLHLSNLEQLHEELRRTHRSSRQSGGDREQQDQLRDMGGGRPSRRSAPQWHKNKSTTSCPSIARSRITPLALLPAAAEAGPTSMDANPPHQAQAQAHTQRWATRSSSRSNLIIPATSFAPPDAAPRSLGAADGGHGDAARPDAPGQRRSDASWNMERLSRLVHLSTRGRSFRVAKAEMAARQQCKAPRSVMELLSS